MSTLSITRSDIYTERYQALLRAANSIGTCTNCDAAGDMLLKALRDIIAFDYLELIAFENDTRTVSWHLLYSKGARQSGYSANLSLEGTPFEWVH
jgi:hypothetical protein